MVERIDLTQVLLRFSEDTMLVRRLFLENETFRSVCGDLALAIATLGDLEKSRRPEKQAVLDDYSRLIADLGQEIEEFLRVARPRIDDENTTDSRGAHVSNL